MFVLSLCAKFEKEISLKSDIDEEESKRKFNILKEGKKREGRPDPETVARWLHCIVSRSNLAAKTRISVRAGNGAKIHQKANLWRQSPSNSGRHCAARPREFGGNPRVRRDSVLRFGADSPNLWRRFEARCRGQEAFFCSSSSSVVSPRPPITGRHAKSKERAFHLPSPAASPSLLSIST